MRNYRERSCGHRSFFASINALSKRRANQSGFYVWFPLSGIKLPHRAKTYGDDFNVCGRNMWTLSCAGRRQPKAALLALTTTGHEPTGEHVDILQNLLPTDSLSIRGSRGQRFYAECARFNWGIR